MALRALFPHENGMMKASQEKSLNLYLTEPTARTDKFLNIFLYKLPKDCNF